jgi:hypothetical protein
MNGTVRCLIAASLSLCCSSWLHAEEPIVIDATSFQQHRSLIVSELQPYVKSGQLAFEYSASAEKLSAPSKESKIPVLERSSLALSALKVVEGDFDLHVLKEQSVVRDFRGRYVRVYPSKLTPPEKNVQLFRERLTIHEPSSLHGYAAFTFRFSSPEEDFLSLFSPALKKSRQLTGTNRSDGILNTGFALDDLFAWSGKQHLIAVEKEREQEALVPLVVAQKLRHTTNGACTEYEQGTPDEGAKGEVPRYNIYSRRYPTAAPWVPTTVTFVKRAVIRLELASKDPYSLYGRQVLYVDKETGLPYYKFVIDKTGRAWKTVIAGYAALEPNASEEKKEDRYLPLFTLVDDGFRGESYVFDMPKVSICSSLPERITGTYFDPRSAGRELF